MYIRHLRGVGTRCSVDNDIIIVLSHDANAGGIILFY